MLSAKASTAANVAAFLAALGIEGVEILPAEPDQKRSLVKALDTRGRLLGHCFVNTRFWSRDSGRNHGKGVRGSFRSRTAPSMQVCIWEVNGRPGLDYFCEIDFDEHSPAVNFFGHTQEVAYHKLTGASTDPEVIARGLAKLLPELPQRLERL